MGDEEDGGARLLEMADAAEALVLEIGVADRERFVDDKDVRPHRRGNREGEPGHHA